MNANDWIVLHDRIGRRAVCAIGAICGDEPIIAIGSSEDDDTEDHHTKAKHAGLRALRKLSAKAAPIVLASVPGGAAAREATHVLLEARRAASDVQTVQTHGEQVVGLVSPLAKRAIGQDGEVTSTPSPHVRALIRQLYAEQERVQQAQRTAMARIRSGTPNTRALWAPMDRAITNLGRIERQIVAAGWSVEVDPSSDFPYGLVTFVFTNANGTEWRP